MIATAKDPALTLRLPKPLRAKVERSAGKAGRSMNTEIIVRIAASFKPIKPDQTK